MDNLLLKGVYNNVQSVAKGYSDGPLLLLLKPSLYIYIYIDIIFSNGQFDSPNSSNG